MSKSFVVKVPRVKARGRMAPPRKVFLDVKKEALKRACRGK